MKTPYFYPRWQQYNTCLAAPIVTGKGHRKIEPKAKHFPIARKTNIVGQTKFEENYKDIKSCIKEFREDSNNIHR